MQDRNLTEGLEISSALSSGSYRKVKYKRMRVSRSGMLIVHNLLWAIPQAFSSPEKAWLREARRNVCVTNGFWVVLVALLRCVRTTNGRCKAL